MVALVALVALVVVVVVVAVVAVVAVFVILPVLFCTLAGVLVFWWFWWFRCLWQQFAKILGNYSTILLPQAIRFGILVASVRASQPIVILLYI